MSTQVHDPLTLAVLVARRPTGVVETTWLDHAGFGAAVPLLFHGECAGLRWQYWFTNPPPCRPLKVVHRKLSLHDKRTQTRCYYCDKPLHLKPF